MWLPILALGLGLAWILTREPSHVSSTGRIQTDTWDAAQLERVQGAVVQCLETAFPHGRSGDPAADLDTLVYCLAETLYPDETWPAETYEAAKTGVWSKLIAVAETALEGGG